MGGGQKNKGHKTGKHSTNGALDSHRKGKYVNPKAARPAGGKAAGGGAGGKAERLLRSKQQQKVKRAALLDARRSAAAAPRVVFVLSLGTGTAAADAAAAFTARLAAACTDAPTPDDAMDSDSTPLSGAAPTVVCGRHGLRLTLLAAEPSALLRCVELAKIADALLLLLPPASSHDASDSTLAAGPAGATLSALRAMGLPHSPLGLLPGLESLPPKDRPAARKAAAKTLAALLPGLEPRLMPLDPPTLAQKGLHTAGAADKTPTGPAAGLEDLLRALASPPPAKAAAVGAPAASGPLWRAHRPYLIAHALSFAPGSIPGEESGTLVVSGYVRGGGGGGWTLAEPTHVPGAGDFRGSRLAPAPDPHPLASRRVAQGAGMDDGAGGWLLLPPGAPAPPVPRENAPDPLAGEQTWPTDAELAEAAAARHAAAAGGKTRLRRLPKGTSDYQAAWIPDSAPGGTNPLEGGDDDNGDSEDEDEEGGDAPMDDGGAAAGGGDDGDGDENDDGDDDEDDVDDLEDREVGGHDGDGLGLDAGAARAAAESAERSRRREPAAHATTAEAAAADASHPDEMDTPATPAARVRFAKFRGLKSFRSSAWDPYEELPPEYARVYAFENARHARARALAAAAQAGPAAITGPVAGAYVTLHLSGVPAAAAAALMAAHCGGAGQHPLVVWGLLQHETKLSVVHFAVTRPPPPPPGAPAPPPGAPWGAHTAPLRGKEELLFHAGYRSFRGRPVYSTDDAAAAKHKLERFLAPGRSAVASLFAPISYPPMPVLGFKESGVAGEEPRLALTGSLRGAGPERVVLKRVVLSGFPLRVHKKRATVRFMFHTADDVRWFSPLELWTKHGRRGRIKEPLGTHGHMKCTFDGVIQQHDTVCASLYKRVYPPWPAPAAFGLPLLTAKPGAAAEAELAMD